MNRRTWIPMLAMMVIASAGQAQHLSQLAAEVQGTVQNWVPGASVVQVGGKVYPLSKDTRVTDRDSALLPLSALKSGLRVQLMIFQGVVTHVVVNPAVGASMDLPKR